MTEEESLKTKKYGTYWEMLEDLEARSKSKNAKIASEAKEIMKKIDDKMQKEIDAYVESEYEREKKESENP